MSPRFLSPLAVLIAFALGGLSLTVFAADDAPHVHTHADSHTHASEHAPHDDPGEISGEAGEQQPLTPGVYTWTLVAGYSILIAAASMLGGLLPGRIALTHVRMQHMISFVGGLMLGIGVFHLLPHSLHHLRDSDQVSYWMMGGIAAMFFLLRAFHFHQHEVPLAEDAAHSEHQHSESCGHSDHAHAHQSGWLGVFLGLGLHTLIDGIALGASIQSELTHVSGFALCGLGTFAAIALHKPLDAISITSLMMAGGWSRTPQLLVNLSFSVLCPLGTVLFVVGAAGLIGDQHAIVGAALAFSAGVFVCIALSDLLPEMEFHSHHRYTLSLALVIGIALAWAIRFLEPAHAHH